MHSSIVSSRIFWLFLICLLTRLSVFFEARNYDGDTFVRSMGALAWSKAPYFITNADQVTWVFAPLPFYLNGFALMFWPDLVLVPRLISLLFGALAIIPFYKLVEEYFDAKKAVYAAIAFCFYSLHVRYSAVASSEAINSFFLLSALWLFFRATRKRTDWNIILAAGSLAVATMVRYENMIFCLFLSALLFVNDRPKSRMLSDIIRFDKQSLRHAGVFFAISSVLVLARFIGDYVVHGDFIHSLPIGKGEHQQLLAAGEASRGPLLHFAYATTFWPGVMIVSLTPLIAVFGIWGLFRTIKAQTPIHLAILFLTTILTYVYQSGIGNSMATFARLSMTFSLLLIPFAGAQWQIVSARFKPFRRELLDGTVIASMLALLVFYAQYGVPGKGTITDKLSSVSPVSHVPYYLEEILHWTTTHLASDDKIILDDFRNQSDFLVMYSHLPREQIKYRWKDSVDISNFVADKRPGFLLHARFGKLSRWMPLNVSDSVQSWNGYVLERRFRAEQYTIYEFKYPKVLNY